VKHLSLSIAAALVLACATAAACDTCGCKEKGKAATCKHEALTGVVKVAKEGEAVKSITLTVACAAECKGCEKCPAYSVKDTADGAVAKLDGKKAVVTGHVDAKAKTVEAEKVAEAK